MLHKFLAFGETMKKAFIFLSLLILPAVSRATLVKSINIEQLVFLSKYIVKATVIKTEAAFDEFESGQMVTYKTLKVHEWIKGESWTGKDEIILKQLADGEFTSQGVTIKQRYLFPALEGTGVFFLPEPHPVTGLSAPIGLHQGIFPIQEVEGKEKVPQLKERAAILRQGLGGKSSSKFLQLQLKNVSDDSYENFKSLIKSAL